ncbi:unnamed protein product [Moneuplotes crassus]|uniref:Protein kinase domain-containing protein n=1 Tax=Euplotes crassus TaxID=5936 RepID=A0AAD1U977_EUPCR|nr:unnamed protein product [Moneuplotes crassus]
MYIRTVESYKKSSTKPLKPYSNLAPSSFNKNRILEPKRRIARRETFLKANNDSRDIKIANNPNPKSRRKYKSVIKTVCKTSYNRISKSRANRRKNLPSNPPGNYTTSQMPLIAYSETATSIHKQISSKTGLRESFTNKTESRVLTPNSKIYENSQPIDINHDKFGKIMNRIREPAQYKVPKMRNTNYAPTDFSEAAKSEFEEKGQKALKELQQFFNRDSVCNDEEGDKVDKSEPIKFKVTKMGFDKPAKEEEPKSKPASLKFQLSDFQILHTLGKGASGVVKLAKHKKKNCNVVLKIYDKYKLIESHLKKSLFKEIELLKCVSHPNIVKLYDVIEDDRHIYLIMEYVSGGSLQQQMRARSKKVTEADTKKIFMQLSSAIKYLHSKNIYHRDIKLDNVLLDYKRNVKLIDFGFSINCKPTNKLKVFCGTPCYMAPEIISKKPYHGGPIDMWALGVILYTLLIGKFPFIGKSESDLYSKIKQGIFSIPDTISFTARKLLGKMLTLDPVKRPTANELYYDEWIRGDTKCFRKMTLKMINDQYSNNPLVKLVKGDKSNTKSLLCNKKDWRTSTRSSLSHKRIDPEIHLKAIDKIRSMGYNYKLINEKLGDCTSDINRMYRNFIR